MRQHFCEGKYWWIEEREVDNIYQTVIIIYMETTNLQIPLSKDLKLSAQQAVFDMGFSSLQEFIRVILKKISTSPMTINLVEEEHLSPKAEKRYVKMIKDIESGKGWHKTESIEDLFRQLK
jgi:antitoxin component of RelBE/YafQ-DinJ toxin-antitoxin module